MFRKHNCIFLGGGKIKYFILRQDPFFLDKFSLGDWQETINPKWISFQDFHKIPPKNILTATFGENVLFPDIVTLPFLLMSSLLINMAEVYGESVYKRDVVVINTKNHQSKHYHLVLLENVGNGHVLPGESNLFCACIKGRKEIVVSQDFAESILRRGAVGIMLEEVDIDEEGLYGE